MVRKNWIVAGCIVAVAAMVYAEKSETKVMQLPAAVQAAVKAMFPAAAIEKSEAEDECAKVYEVKIKDNGKESEVMFAADGTMTEMETVEAADAIPVAVAEAIKAQNGKVTKIEKSVVHAELKFVKLETPVTSYEAKVTKGGKDMEIKFAADGKILNQEVKAKDEDKD